MPFAVVLLLGVACGDDEVTAPDGGDGTAPTLDAIFPVGASVGANLTLRGQNFGTTGTVSFGNVTVSSFTLWSESKIGVVVPLLDPPNVTEVDVTVAVAGKSSNAVTFTREAAGVTRLTRDGYTNWQACWAGNSTIFFASNRGGNFNIWYFDDDGDHLTQRTSFATGDTDMPATDVATLYYRSSHDGDWDIYSSSGPGAELRLTSTPEKDFEIAVSGPLGPYRFAISRAEAFNGGTIWNIWGHGSTGWAQISDQHADFHPTFSPNGQHVAFMNKAGDWVPGQIVVVATLGGGPVPISDPTENCAYPAWNPVYDVIAYTRSSAGKRNVFACEQDGTNEVQLTDFWTDVLYPAWAPDGRRLAYTAFVSGSYELFVADVGSALRGAGVGPASPGAVP
ncbi:MAG: PD40 domain-containing protein [Gemmatimonadetes bacterium]|nr:PD40 domain-containing protein [Gemmatimonadota bacterium]